jgi:hypothetical protein
MNPAGIASTLRTRMVHESRAAVVIFAHLALLFGAFTTYRRILMAEYHIGYLRYGYALFEALVLTKLILVGRFLRLGERFHDRPLILAVLYKTLWFSLLVLLFSVLEHVAVNLWDGKGAASALDEIARNSMAEALSKLIVVVTAFVPLFALLEVGRVFGEGKLFELFFTRKGRTLPELPANPDRKA